MVIQALLLSFALLSAPSPDLTPAEIESVDALFATWDRADSPGCSLAIVKDGQLAYARSYGAADLEREVPLTPDSVFRIASTSKQFTAACILLLEQDGLLTLEDDVQKWIPELSCPLGKVQLQHLVHHTGGLRDYLWLMSLAGYEDAGYYTEEAALAMLARQRGAEFAPGERYAYSNSGFFLLSIVVERVSGKRLREFAQERIFEPLGMTRTHFHDDHTELVPGRALGYARGDGTYRLSMTRLEMCGDGGLFTTVRDLTRWMANFRDLRVGNEAWLARMLEPGKLNDGEELDYASGLVLQQWKGKQQIFHGGAFVGYRAEMLHLPELGFGVVCLANIGEFNPTARCEEIRDLLLGAEAEEPAEESVEDPDQAEFEPAVVERERLRAWEGTWLETDGDSPRVIHVRARRESLQLRGSGAGQRFLPESDRTFVNTNGDARLEFEERADEPDLLILVRESAQPATFERVDDYSPTREQLAEYEGDYWSEELQALYRVHAQDKGLVVNLRGTEVGSLEPVLQNRFGGPYGSQLFFERKDKLVSGFDLDLGGVHGLRFVRTTH